MITFSKLKSMPDQEMVLSANALDVRVGSLRVLNGQSLKMRRGERVLVRGPNGSGKSTLLNAIAGTKPARLISGSIQLDGVEISGMVPSERASLGIGYLRQIRHVFDELTIYENLILALGCLGYDLFADHFPHWRNLLPPEKKAGLLSGGQKKILAFAMTALRSDIKLLLLDEPRAGLAQDLDLKLPAEPAILMVEHF